MPAPDSPTRARAVTAERSDKLIQPNAQHHYEVTQDDLPLSCPMPGMHLWNSHPRVFLADREDRLGEVPVLLGGVRAEARLARSPFHHAIDDCERPRHALLPSRCAMARRGNARDAGRLHLRSASKTARPDDGDAAGRQHDARALALDSRCVAGAAGLERRHAAGGLAGAAEELPALAAGVVWSFARTRCRQRRATMRNCARG